ncbi:MAG: bifunctional [glutamate--ammonia ligase]-adenylyl-L-tyrosine phosphorylase/[glutamate--ammonia-ligase] adenylyltransferase [Thermodesulfobacteriota bacterium]
MAAIQNIALPPEITSAVQEKLAACQQAMENEGLILDMPLENIPGIERVWAFSEFISKTCIRHPALLTDLSGSGDLETRYNPGEYTRRLEMLDPIDRDPIQVLQKQLRRFRAREMVRIAWRDLAGWAGLDSTLMDLSALADACIEYALKTLYEHQCRTYGAPFSKDGNQQFLVVLGLGKLGGEELNFSSDIDLIFAYDRPGKTEGGTTVITNEDFFVRLCRSLIRALGEKGADGLVFRVDMRLRPDGENGPLVMSFDNMEAYYQRHGREWERYAWIKARVVAGDKAAGKRLTDGLKPFVYRRYLDFGVFESLRDMKQKIALEVTRKSMGDDIKLGPGGIREIEFFGQVFQLIRGGVTPELQNRRIRPVLKLLVREGYIDQNVCFELIDAYHFLRNTEHRLQEFNDQQTHKLPGESKNRQRLALSMGYENREAFLLDLNMHRRTVQTHFSNLLETNKPETVDCEEDTAGDELACLWNDVDIGDPSLNALSRLGFTTPDEVVNLLKQFKQSPGTRALSREGRKRIDKLMPLVLKEAAASDQSVVIVKRIITLLEAIVRRTNYLSLLLENPRALTHLIRLADASPWIITFLSLHPVLLDELLDPRALYSPPDRHTLQKELAAKMEQMPADDLEYQMEALCIFRQANTLKVAAADITEVLPLMKVSDHLSDLAETILSHVITLCWNYLTQRHGKPAARIDSTNCAKGFAVIAYGKLGGLELGYGSDLDLVFIHAGTPGQTSGDASPIENTQFYSRLGRRVIHILTANTSAGKIYEIDMRLRPSGSAGILVSQFESFAAYQFQDAWTWEHQALLRARAIAGDDGLVRWFENTRKEILTRRRDPLKLKREVKDMRDRMRRELLKQDPDTFDLKQGRGGIVDIEFLIQYLILLHAHQFPDLVTYSDNVRQIRSLEETGILDETTAYLLRRAYLVYRATTHRLNLKEESSTLAGGTYLDVRRRVSSVWDTYMV